MMRHGFIVQPTERGDQHQILFQQFPRLPRSQSWRWLLDLLLNPVEQAPAIVAQMVAHGSSGAQHVAENQVQAAGMLRLDHQIQQFLPQSEKPGARRFRHWRHRNFQRLQQIVQATLISIVLLPFQQPSECFPQQPGGAVQPFAVTA